ncbi:MAG: FkbM family methyltransferase [Nitrospinaceae bacterium]|nr:FkbM family methyltransferase [Nitrospinaceae bacterium]
MPNPLDQLQGKPISEVLAFAEERVVAGGGSLEEALQVYRAVVAEPSIGEYLRGMVEQSVWETEKNLGLHAPFFSQAGQDKYIAESLLDSKREGVFVEIGAFDGVRGSNCLYFEKFLGWQGLIVEPDANLADTIRGHRTGAYECAALSDADGEEDFVAVEAGFLQMGGLLRFYDEEILNANVRSNPGHREAIRKIPVLRLATLLERHSIKDVDYCSIDVEGAEEGVLSGFDFSKFNIHVLSVENNGHTEGAVTAIMKKNGYKLETILGSDEIWSRL